MEQAEFCQQLEKLGIAPGDSIYLRAALAKLGIPEWRSTVDWLVEYLGEEGTFLAPAFTGNGYVFCKPYPVFDKKTVPNSGALSKLALAHPRALRSSHPTHSFVAIGRHAEELLAGHDEHAASFLPVKKFVELGGTMLLVGCNAESPGFSTVHCVQHDLGLSQKHLLRYLVRVNLRTEDGGLKSWSAAESPGCSKSFDKFYPAYIRTENFRTGLIGDAWTIAVKAEEAYATELNILKRNPRFVDCGKPDCLTCSLRSYHLSRIPGSLFHFCRQGFRKVFGKLRPSKR